MKFYITTANLREYVLDLPVTDEISWQDFVKLQQVQDLCDTVIDITPEHMLLEQIQDSEPAEADLQDIDLNTPLAEL